MTRHDGRNAGELRPVQMDTNYLMHPEGSVLITVGNTKVICTATVEEKVQASCEVKEKAGLQRSIQCYHVRQSSVHAVNRQLAR